MILTVLKIQWLRLWHNRAEWVLAFAVPIMFFSIFAIIFGSRDSSTGSTPRINVGIVDLARNATSQKISQALRGQAGLRFHQPATRQRGQESWCLESTSAAEELIQHGTVSAAIVLRENHDGDRTSVAASGGTNSRLGGISAEVLADTYDQVAPQVVVALVQQAIVANLQSAIHAPGADLNVPIQSSVDFDRLLPTVKVIDVLGKGKSNPVIAMYAAGIAVMFLLFSVTSAAGSLLEEQESGTLERLLCTRMSMDELLMSKWLFLMLQGCAQVSLMFLWGQLVFGVDLFRHWDGFLIMTLATAGAAASFALLLATLCGSRNQLVWISTILILSSSALGGSMVPRYLMSDSMQRLGLATFNAWALDGYNKIFWRELPVKYLWPQLLVLGGCGLAFIVFARILAVRWERV